MTDKLATIEELLAVAVEAAQAGAAVLDQRVTVSASGLRLNAAEAGLETKTSAADVVTDFDRDAEAAVRSVISKHRPHDVISGEEYGTTDVAEPSGYRWSIDPLDGTSNFVRGILYYGTSVGLMDPQGRWIVGVVRAPALKRLWWGAHGLGAFTQLDGGQPVALNGPHGPRAAGIISTGFGYDPERRNHQVATAAAVSSVFGNMRRLGAAALDICMVADGTQDIYLEFGIQEHDWAAGCVIAEEAGVSVYRPAYADGTTSPDWCIIGELTDQLPHVSPAPAGLAGLSRNGSYASEDDVPLGEEH